ncbi:MAG: hypothetical protein K2N84_01445, partial [Clostridia bacterium]|nr:hypothetical protein [Clostridia bacterium]
MKKIFIFLHCFFFFAKNTERTSGFFKIFCKKFPKLFQFGSIFRHFNRFRFSPPRSVSDEIKKALQQTLQRLFSILLCDYSLSSAGASS